MTLKEWQVEAHKVAKEKGWYDPSKTDLEAIMLMVTELAEAAEEIRNDRPNVYVGLDSKPEGLAVELADVVLRIVDFCQYKGIDLEQAMKFKHEYNKIRPYRHGGKLA